MPVKRDIRPWLAEHTEIPFDRLRAIQTIEGLSLPELGAAVVFVFAEWGGVPQLVFRRFTRVLSKLDPGEALEIILLDNDCIDGKNMVRLFGHVCHGYGETFWIQGVELSQSRCGGDQSPSR